ncbi:MAG: alpha/beta hydrolase [Balneolaceae bacterium]|nr:MAG: alpha/beta hydrolase [Balneolaceae bacterium]
MKQVKAEKPDVLVSGKTSFKIEVPYKLIETGNKGESKPLILYLHGFGENLKTFEEVCKPFLILEAYHLFIQGPYPLYDKSQKKTVSKWGSSWYLYDGKRKQFIKSLELSSEFIQEIIDNLVKFLRVSKMCVFGYSMGGYLAGYFALTRWKHVNDLIVTGCRIKTEVIQDGNWANLSHLEILALHGSGDSIVDYIPQKKEIEKLNKLGVKSSFRLLDADHSLSGIYIEEVIDWLKNKNYRVMK